MVLAQEFPNGLHPCAFLSRKLSEAELNYATHEKELLTLVYALKAWCHYILGSVTTTCYTDHQPLRYFQSQPHLNPRQTRWMQLLQEYDIYVEYLPGRANVVADGLSRCHTIGNNTVSGFFSFMTHFRRRGKKGSFATVFS